jgi:hypothetical protein
LDILRSAIIALLILSLTGCHQNSYRVVERTQRLIPDASEGTHVEVGYVLTHGGHKIYATCDHSDVDKLDPQATCGLRPLRTYKCELGPDDIRDAALPLSDLKCKDASGRNVYLYVSKEE